MKKKILTAVGLAMACGAAFAQQGASVSELEANPRPPKMLTGACAKPDYPRSASRAGEVGTTKIRFQVAQDGTVTQAQVLRTSGSPALDEAAVTSLSKCRFEPASMDGKPIAGSTVVEYIWKLDDEPQLPLAMGPNLSFCPTPREPAGEPERAKTVVTRVKLEFQRYGRVVKADVESSSGSPALDRAVVEAYGRCTFTPSVLGSALFVSVAVVDHAWRPNAPRTPKP